MYSFDLSVSVCPFRCPVCEPFIYTGWRLDRDLQFSDKPVFVAYGNKTDGCVKHDSVCIIDLDQKREAPPIKSDESDVSPEDRAIEKTKAKCAHMYRQWLQSEVQWNSVSLPIDSKNPNILESSVLVSVYAGFMAPSDHERAFRVIERRIDHVTLSFSDIAYPLMKNKTSTIIYQNATRYKLGVAIDLSRSFLVNHAKNIKTCLQEILSRVTEKQFQEYQIQLSNAKEIALRFARLANNQFYALHPTRRVYNAEQTLRKFNGSYFLSTTGAPHPGMRWLWMQAQSLSKLDWPTVTAWLRIALLAERVTYHPSECKSVKDQVRMARRLFVCMSALVARSTIYMADTVDRCDPSFDTPFVNAINSSNENMQMSAKARPPLPALAKTGASRSRYEYNPHTRQMRHTPSKTQPLVSRRRIVHELLSRPSVFIGAKRTKNKVASLPDSLQMTKKVNEPCRHSCSSTVTDFVTISQAGYSDLTFAEVNEMTDRLCHVSTMRHITEQIDEYDGLLDCMHPGLSCNDCETQSCLCFRCTMALTKFLDSVTSDSLQSQNEVMTHFERQWMSVIVNSTRQQRVECVSVLCALAMSGMDDGGKRGARQESKGFSMASRDILERNMSIESRHESDAPLPRFDNLFHHKDGTTWDYWPDVTRMMTKRSSKFMAEKVIVPDAAMSPEPLASPILTDRDKGDLDSIADKLSCRFYEGQRTRDSPDLGCHVCPIIIDVQLLRILALRGIMVEKHVQETNQPLDDHDNAVIRSHWQTELFIKGSRGAVLLTESTEFSQCQQFGNECDGQGAAVNDTEEHAFYNEFKRSFGPENSFFLFRLSTTTTKNYDMYYFAMEISSHSLQEEFGCGNWIWYNLDTGRHGIDFRDMCSLSCKNMNFCLRPSTPIMSATAFKKINDALQPIEKLMPQPPIVQNVTNASSLRLNKTDVKQFSLFINVLYWETKNSAGVILREAFSNWAKTRSISFTTELVQIHRFHTLVVIRCTPEKS